MKVVASGITTQLLRQSRCALRFGQSSSVLVLLLHVCKSGGSYRINHLKHAGYVTITRLKHACGACCDNSTSLIQDMLELMHLPRWQLDGFPQLTKQSTLSWVPPQSGQAVLQTLSDQTPPQPKAWSQPSRCHYLAAMLYPKPGPCMRRQLVR